jgi:hypothetical protein
MHQRRIIREAVANLLKANAPAFGGAPDTPGDARVFASREAPANVMTLLQEGPMANVYARSDHIKPEDYPKSGFDSAVKHTLELAVEVTAVGAWTVDEKLDDLADEIELLLEPFQIPGLPSAELRLSSTQIDSTDEFEQPLGGALMLYEITYWRPYRTDTSEENKICHAYANGPDGVVAEVGSCDGECVPGPVNATI